MIDFVTWPPLNEFHSNNLKHLSVIDDFFTSANIKAFGHTYVGRAASYWPCIFYTQGVLFSICFIPAIITINKHNVFASTL